MQMNINPMVYKTRPHGHYRRKVKSVELILEERSGNRIRCKEDE